MNQPVSWNVIRVLNVARMKIYTLIISYNQKKVKQLEVSLHDKYTKKNNNKVGPLLVTSGVITSISRVITSWTYHIQLF